MSEPLLPNRPFRAGRGPTNRPQHPSDNPDIATLARDINFYSGLSHLAISQDDEYHNKIANLERSILLLKEALSLARTSELDADREHYFLGLAYYFSGRSNLACSEWSKIDSASEFYTDTQKLLKRLE